MVAVALNLCGIVFFINWNWTETETFEYFWIWTDSFWPELAGKATLLFLFCGLDGLCDLDYCDDFDFICETWDFWKSSLPVEKKEINLEVTQRKDKIGTISVHNLI